MFKKISIYQLSKLFRHLLLLIEQITSTFPHSQNHFHSQFLCLWIRPIVSTVCVPRLCFFFLIFWHLLLSISSLETWMRQLAENAAVRVITTSKTAQRITSLIPSLGATGVWQECLFITQRLRPKIRICAPSKRAGGQVVPRRVTDSLVSRHS